MVGQREDAVGYKVDQFKPMAFFAAIYLAALYELQRDVCRRLGKPMADQRLFDQIFHEEDGSAGVRWPPRLDSYFAKDGKDLKTNGDREARHEMAGLIRKASLYFLNDLRTLLDLPDLNFDGTPFALFQRLSELPEAADANETDDPLTRFLGKEEVVISTADQIHDGHRRRGQGRPSFRFDVKDWYRAGKKGNQFRDEASKQLSRVAKECMSWLRDTCFRRDDPGHGTLPGVPIDCESYLKTRFFGLRAYKDSSPWSWAPLAIIREARGQVTNKKCDVGIIVRDVLWLRPHSGEAALSKGETYDDEVRGAKLGFYFSTMDRQVYEVRSIRHRNGVYVIDGIAYLDGAKTKSLGLYLPDITHPALFSMGSLVGSIRGLRRTGAWTVVAAPFSSIDKPPANLNNLGCDLCVYLDAMADYAGDIKLYDQNIGEAMRFIERNQLAGVLYSKAWEQSASAELAEMLKARRNAFREFFIRSEEYVGIVNQHADEAIGRMRTVLDTKGDETARDVGPEQGFERLRNELRDQMFSEESHAVAPDLSDGRYWEVQRENGFAPSPLYRLLEGGIPDYDQYQRTIVPPA